jgi:DNA-binding MarR family transcriptional regulator
VKIAPAALMRRKPLENEDNADVRNLIERLRDVDLIMHRRLWRELKFNEKPAYVMMLGKLRRREKTNPEGIRVSELATAFEITASGVTQMITGLEERGYVDRSMDPEDRRAVRVCLTEAGRKEADSMLASIDALFAGLVEYLGEKKSRELLESLSEVCNYFDRLASRHASNSEEAGANQ